MSRGNERPWTHAAGKFTLNQTSTYLRLRLLHDKNHHCSGLVKAGDMAKAILRECSRPGGSGAADLSKLIKLPDLNLDQCPADFKTQLCQGLQSLNLANLSRIRDLPTLVESFTKLTSITLMGNRLDSFPPQLEVLLGSLKELVLGNQNSDSFRELTPRSLLALGPRFTALTALSLEDVGLTEVPWLSSCSSLTVLRLRKNYIVELPLRLLYLLPEIRDLDISSNELKGLEFLAALPRHPRLEALNVQDNFLTELPTSLVGLKNSLKTLVANPQKEGEALRVPPEEVLAKPTPDVLRFLDELAKSGKQTRTLMRVSFVGEAGAGKTHLCLSLQDRLEQ